MLSFFINSKIGNRLEKTRSNDKLDNSCRIMVFCDEGQGS